MNNTAEVSVKTCFRCKCEKPHFEFYKDKNRHDKLTPTCKQCMQEYAKKRRETGRERQVQREWRKTQRTNPNGRYRAGRLIQEAKSRSECSLTLDWVADRIALGVCEVTGLQFDISSHGSPPNCFAPSLDRIDPTKGYHADNVQVVVWIYNRAKGPNTKEDVLQFCKAYVAANDN